MTPSETIEQLLSEQPDELIIGDARPSVRAHNERTGRRIVVLDDDPTGSQSVHDVQVVTVFERSEYADALRRAGETCFVLTNTRSLDEAEARGRNREIAADLYALEGDQGGPTEIISRSDSCLRGHVLTEIDELANSSERAAGRPVDGVIFVPALLSAGRFTLDDVHWAVIDGTPVPVAETEFARDATFGYQHSRLAEFLAEKSAGVISPSSVLSVSLADIRLGGPDRVAEVLIKAEGRQWIVINALTENDLDVVALGINRAQDHGRTFLYRTGPSFVRALAGLDPGEPLTRSEIGCRADSRRAGLIVVGSHTQATTRQLDQLRSRFAPAEFELDVPTLLSAGRTAHIDATANKIIAALADDDTDDDTDVLLYTSRQLTTGADAAASLDIARGVSTALVETVSKSRSGRPAWVLAKGGITSHDVAVRGLGITRAKVVGQFAAGGISLFRPIAAPADVRGLPYVVFPGNVGGPSSVAEVVAVLREGAAA